MAETRLPFWAGFQNRSGMYGGLVDGPSDGTVRVVLGSSGVNPAAPDASYHALIDRVMAAELAVSAIVLGVIWAAYPGLRAEFEEMYGEPPGDLMPELAGPEALRDVIGLHTLHIHGIEGGGVPYCGYEFGCTWEDEHGFGVLMHGTEPVELGHADTAFTLWMAARHAKDNGLEITGPMAELAKD